MQDAQPKVRQAHVVGPRQLNNITNAAVATVNGAFGTNKVHPEVTFKFEERACAIVATAGTSVCLFTPCGGWEAESDANFQQAVNNQLKSFARTDKHQKMRYYLCNAYALCLYYAV